MRGPSYSKMRLVEISLQILRNMPSMRSTHSQDFTETQLPMLAKSSEQPAQDTFNSICLLCDYVPGHFPGPFSQRDSQINTVDVTKDLQKHMAIHLESLAILSPLAR